MTWFHRDVLSDDQPSRIPATAAAFVGDQVWLLVPDTDGRTSRIDVPDLTSGTIATRRTFPACPAPPFRVVDRALRIRSEVAGGPGSPLAAADGTIVLGGGAELAVRRPDGSLHASPDLRLIAAGTALVVGPITGPDAEYVPTTATDAGAPDAAPDAMGSPAGWSRAAALVAAAALAAGWRRRRTRTDPPR